MIFLEIIDIRDNNSFNINHLSDSINIPFNKLIIEPGKYLDKNKKYLLVCDYGIKSKKTADILNKMGYQVYSLKDGIKKYIQNKKM